MVYRVVLLTYLLMLLFGQAGCVQPQLQSARADATRVPELNPVSAIMSDGYSLPLSIYQPEGSAHAIVLALHGFNDYRNAFHEPARFLAQHGILTVAYDQRGFGKTEQRGLWAGQERMQQDAHTVIRLLCEQHPGVPLYLLGESMGGAVVIEALQQEVPECVAGAVLVAPAVWGWQTMPWWQTLALRTAAHLFPAATVTGKGLDIKPSDNIDMLRALGRDPLVIKATRIDTIYGLTNLMDTAYTHAMHFPVPVLLLYGVHDEIIPPEAMCRFQTGFLSAADGMRTMVLYPDGYHMLTRDLQAATVLRDMAAWVVGQRAALPSGSTVASDSARLQEMCGTHW
jgi:alpha-beta hydrolase superfamily lysophospholipase